MNDQGRKLLGARVPLRFVQIATGVDSEGHALYGLSEDGQVYQYHSRVVDLAKPKVGANGGLIKREYRYFWHPLPMSDQLTPAHEEV